MSASYSLFHENIVLQNITPWAMFMAVKTVDIFYKINRSHFLFHTATHLYLTLIITNNYPDIKKIQANNKTERHHLMGGRFHHFLQNDLSGRGSRVQGAV